MADLRASLSSDMRMVNGMAAGVTAGVVVTDRDWENVTANKGTANAATLTFPRTDHACSRLVT